MGKGQKTDLKAAIIGASEESLHTIEKAKEQGLTVVALDGNPEAAGLKAADRGIVVNISNEKETFDILQKEKVDFILTVPIGRYLTTTGSMNDALNLKGISRDNALICTDKWLFHKKLQQEGLRSCQAVQIPAEADSPEKLTAEIAKLNFHYPAILKPEFGSGSRGIVFLKDSSMLKSGLAAVQGEDYILEECAEGTEYGLDGAFVEGVFHLILLRRKENTPLPARQATAYFSVSPDEPFFREVRTFMEKVVRVLKLKDCLLHADLIQGKNGPFLIEMSARPSGHNLHNLFTPLCTGIDMAEEYIKYLTGKPFCFDPVQTRSMMIHYFDYQGTVQAVPTLKDLETSLSLRPVRWDCRLQKGDRLSAPSNGHTLMARGYYILEGRDENALKIQAAKIRQLFF